MALSAGDSELRPYRSHDRALTKQWARVTIGGSGVATVAASSSGFTCVRASAGVYTVGFRAGLDGLVPDVSIKSAAPTIFGWQWTAFDATAGTGTLRFNNAAGAATDPASGDVLGIKVDILPFKDG